MERYNIFNQVHKGLRAFLYDTALRVQQTDFLRIEEALPTLSAMNDLLYHFGQHALYVERFLFPFIRPYNPGLANTLQQQHQTHTSLAQRLRGTMNVYDHAVSSPDKTEAGKQLLKSFTGFVIAHLDHMGREDNLINHTLWRHFTDAELQRLEREIVINLSARDLGVYSQWMMRGMNNTEIVAWLKEHEKNADPYFFSALFQLAEKELPAYRWQQVQEGLVEGTLA